MTTVYIVTSGAYSNYQIEGVFDSEDVANEFAENFSEDPEVRAWEVNTTSPSPVWTTTITYLGPLEAHQSGWILAEDHKIQPNKWMCHCRAASLAHAMKVFRERHRQMVAEGTVTPVLESWSVVDSTTGAYAVITCPAGATHSDIQDRAFTDIFSIKSKAAIGVIKLDKPITDQEKVWKPLIPTTKENR